MTCDLTSGFNCHEDPLGPSLTDACPGSNVFVFMFLLNSLIRKNRRVSGLCERVVPVRKPYYEYDFIVIGEAGQHEPLGTEVPGFATFFLGTKIIWNYTTTNESHACRSTNGSCAWPSGKNLGGNTPHNAMIYLRGNPTDYNNWADLGNDGWTWEEVEPFFKKSEDNGEIERVGRKHHGTGGPLCVERSPDCPAFCNSILEASAQAGYGVNDDLNGDEYLGFSITQAMAKKGVRCSSARAYLWPVRNRENLHVLLNAHATRLITKNGRTIGVEYSKDGERRRVHVTREVIVSCGVVESPHLLMLSGIGPKAHLESMGIKVVKDLPGVGENLHDHPCAIIPFTINESDTYDNDWVAADDYLAYQTGPLSNIGTAQVVGLLASKRTTPDHPDIEVYFQGYHSTCAPGKVGALQTNGRRTLNLLVSYLHPKSRGRVTLASKDPFEYPTIWTNYLGEDEDLKRLVEGINMSMKLLDTEALRRFNFTMTNAPLAACSNHRLKSDRYWACVAKQNNYALYHQGGTCKMGPSSDPMAVVDHRLRVHGMKGLRVADNSVMPRVSSGNTAAPAMMIGERVASFIKKDWSPESDPQELLWGT